MGREMRKQKACTRCLFCMALLRATEIWGSVSPCSLLDQLRAFALDLGGSTLEEPTDLEIVVVDQNDNRPVFGQEVFTGRVLEGAVPGEAGSPVTLRPPVPTGEENWLGGALGRSEVQGFPSARILRSFKESKSR